MDTTSTIGLSKIPGFSRYYLTSDNAVYDVTGGKFLRPHLVKRYVYYSMFNDLGVKSLISEHRIIALVRVNPDGSDKTIVNHKDGNKLNNQEDNLEWVSYKGNIEHAGSLGLTEKCKPIEIRNILTGVITSYPSYVECAKGLGISKNAVAFRAKTMGQRAFPDFNQYRQVNCSLEWGIVDEFACKQFGRNRPIVTMNVLTGEEKAYLKLSDYAREYEVSLPAAHKWVNSSNQPVVTGFVQLKYAGDRVPWRQIDDPFLEYEQFSGKKIVVKFQNNAPVEIYLSAANCAKVNNIAASSLNVRLNKTHHDDTFIYYVNLELKLRSLVREIAREMLLN